MGKSKPYQLNLTEAAERNLKRIDKKQAGRIMQKLLELADDVDAVDHYALKGQWKGLYRIRIGDYRVIYDLIHEDHLIVVAVIGHRRDVYEA